MVQKKKNSPLTGINTFFSTLYCLVVKRCHTLELALSDPPGPLLYNHEIILSDSCGGAHGINESAKTLNKRVNETLETGINCV